MLGCTAEALSLSLRDRLKKTFWTAWTGLFRMTRNDAGHPKSIEPVTREAVHGQLLLLHEHARLVFDLGAWIDSTF
jgi:hypothetical protein